MNNELKDILSNSSKEIDNQRLMDYLSKKLSETGNHEVEKAMTDDDFVNDAVEGLEEIKDKKKIEAYVQQLNEELHRQVAKNNKRREKRRWKDSPYTYYAIATILLLLLLCYFVIFKKHSP